LAFRLLRRPTIFHSTDYSVDFTISNSSIWIWNSDIKKHAAVPRLGVSVNICREDKKKKKKEKWWNFPQH
jgi:hypothetical protein